VAGRGRGLCPRAWPPACPGPATRVAGGPPGGLPAPVAPRLAPGLAPHTLAGRIGCGARRGQRTPRGDLPAGRPAVGHDRGDGRDQARVGVAAYGPPRPRQGREGGEARLARGRLPRRTPTTAPPQPGAPGAQTPPVRRAPLGREAIPGEAHAAWLLGARGQSPTRLTRMAGPQGSRPGRSARAPMGFGDGEPGGARAGPLARGRALGLPPPAPAPAHRIAIRGTGRCQALGRRRAPTQARARTRRVRAAARSRGHGEEASERLHGLIPRQGVPPHQEVTAMEAGQPCRGIPEARCGVSSLWGAHGHLLARVLSTLVRVEGRGFAHEHPLSLTG